MKAIESLTYTCNEHEPLIQLICALDQVFTEFKKELPQEQGLVIRSFIAKRTKKVGKANHCKNISSLKLYKKCGRACLDSKYTNRVGMRADKIRKVKL